MDKSHHLPILEINGKSIHHNMIEYMSINRFAFLNIPIVEFKASLAVEDILDKLLTEKVFKAGFDIIGKTREVYEFYVTDVINIAFHHEKETIVTIKGLLDVRAFINTPAQISFKEKSSNEVLSLLQTVLPDIKYKGDDIQTWISYNIPEIQFAKELIEHSYIEENNFAVPYLGLNKELVVKSYKDILLEEDSFKVTDTPIAPNISFFSNDYEHTFNLEEAKGYKELQFINAVAFIPTTNSKSNHLVTTDKVMGKSYIKEQKTNIGNVHPMFYKQAYINKQSWRFLQKYMVSFTYNTLLLDSDTELLQQIKFDLTKNTSTLFKKDFTLLGVTKRYSSLNNKVEMATTLIGGRGDLL